MTLDLGQFPAVSDMVRVTADYSNAVLVAILPYISDVAQKLDLPVPHPVTAAQVLDCSIPPTGKAEAQVIFRGGWSFSFRRGYVETIQSPHCYTMLQNPDDIPLFYGEVKMSRAEAVQMARDTLKKLALPLESVFAEQEPEVSGPPIIGTNIVPHYQLLWPHPRGGTSVQMEVNANLKRVERIKLRNESLERPPPKVSVIPEHDPRSPAWPQVNPEYARQLIPMMLRAIDEYGQKLLLPVPQPLSTNHVARIRIRDNLGGPYSEIELTNGWRFLYEDSMVTSYTAPDALFAPERRGIRLKDFLGKWNMTETNAIELIRRTVAKLGYPTNLVHMDFAPQVSKPAVPGIPRYLFHWYYSLESDSLTRSAVSAEVDADKGEMKSLYCGNIAFRGRKPNIDVPILLPTPPKTNQPPVKPSSTPPARKAPRQPLDHPVPLSR